MSVTARGMSVQEAYREYRAGNFRINRRYQRKLVWTMKEKEALVDSILRGYPIPLILLAYSVTEEGQKTFEILDGMQRLNAVFTFLENAFPVNGKFFDTKHLSRAKQLAAAGEFKAITEPTLLLSDEQCADILDYNFAVSEFPGANQGSVHEIFGRINSYGKQLSHQERRQAGVISPFSDLVRELGAELRGDVSVTTLDLSDMPSISIDIGADSSKYGISADSTFWCRQGILRRSQLRDSDDEQLLADLVISVLLDEPFGFSGTALDEYYTANHDHANDINTRLALYGQGRLKTEIIGTISVLRDVIESVDPQPNALRRTVFPSSANPIKTAFFAVFSAFFQLCVVERKSPADSPKILAALQNLQSKLNVAAGQIRSEPRKQNIVITKALVEPHFIAKEPPALIHSPGAAVPFENALRRSQIESAAFECKQGLLRLDGGRTQDPDLLDKIVRTLCGIANIGPSSSGALFIGVADSDSDRKRIEDLDSISSAHVGTRFVVGVERELKHLGCTLDTYMGNIIKHIRSSGLSEPLKATVLANCDCISYRGMHVVCLWVPSQKVYSSVDDHVFVRQGSSTLEASGATAINSVFQRFN